MSREIELVLIDKTKNYLKYEMKVVSKEENKTSPTYNPMPEIIANAYLHRTKYGENVPKSVKLVIEE